ncbi:hypothetical protein FRC11_006543 [Ceratobasidium sp. 423]|nr:hypothetical protein FRC11_006543 [Ceratobasidium sp. 423]
MSQTLDPTKVDTDNVQGDIYPGFAKKNETFLFFRIADPAKFQGCLHTLKVTSAADMFQHRQDIHTLQAARAAKQTPATEAGGQDISIPKAVKAVSEAAGLRPELQAITRSTNIEAAIAKGPNGLIPMILINIAFSRNGLNKLGITETLNQTDANDPFEQGQLDNAQRLGDMGSLGPEGFTPTTWNENFLKPIDGVFLVAGDCPASVNKGVADILSNFSDSIQNQFYIKGAVRCGKEKASIYPWHDGISNPSLKDVPRAPDPYPGPPQVSPGVIICGHDGDPVSSRPEWVKEGSYLAFRKLQQYVPEFWNFLEHPTVAPTEKPVYADPASPFQKSGSGDTNPNQKSSDDNCPKIPPHSPEAIKLGSQLVGRWPSGASIQVTPNADDPTLGNDKWRNNDFIYPSTSGDDGQKNCPYSAHLRKVNPRTDLAQHLKVDRARLIRAGIPYGPEVTKEEWDNHKTTVDRGLAFVCYQSYLANGFQFVQTIWANDPTFVQGKGVDKPGFDTIIGQQNSGGDRDTKGQASGTSLDLPMEFVLSRGGEYFFSPSIKALKTRFVESYE